MLFNDIFMVSHYEKGGPLHYRPSVKKNICIYILGYSIPSDRQFSSNFDFSVQVSNDSNEISYVKKKSLKKIKYCQRNGGFTFWREVKITRLIEKFSAVFANQFFSLETDTVSSQNS